MLRDTRVPPRSSSTTIVSVSGLTVEFPVSTPLRDRLAGRRRAVHAVNGVDLDIARGSSLGIVGESGSGKTTLAKAICGLVAPTEGSICIDVERLEGRPPPVQMVFQDPTSSLDPRQTAGDAIEEMLRTHRLVAPGVVASRRAELLDLVGLPQRAANVLPRHLSGGQRQRVAIARALALEPPVLVADEAVASLDVSVKAGILNLLRDLQRSLGLTLIMVTHDLATVRHVTDEVAVMYLGRIVEHGPVHAVLGAARHPYTVALDAAAPRLLADRERHMPALAGEPPSPLVPPGGCAFHPRCPHAIDACRTRRPELVDVGDRQLACPVR